MQTGDSSALGNGSNQGDVHGGTNMAAGREREREREPVLPPPAHGLEMQSVVPRGMAEDSHALIQARGPPPAHGQGSAECPAQPHFHIPREQAFFLTTRRHQTVRRHGSHGTPHVPVEDNFPGHSPPHSCKLTLT